MSSNPVIFLAFANSSVSPLYRLSKEDDTLYQLLHERASKHHHFQIHRESHANLDKLRAYFTSYKDQIMIFHYAGHAGSTQLLLQEDEVNSGGIAEMLAEQKNLKLVFLNGCSTEAQVSYLLELGIPAVIATAAPIEDELAVKFAEHFYRALVNDHTFGEAYEQAASYMRASGKGTESLELRDLMLDMSELSELDKLKWGIFTQPGKHAPARESRRALPAYHDRPCEFVTRTGPNN